VREPIPIHIPPARLRALRRRSFFRWFGLTLGFGTLVAAAVQLARLIEPDGFMPHGHCYRWRPEVLWPSVIADAVIALSYFLIPLWLLVMSKVLPGIFPFQLLTYLFAVFIVSCGLTHVVEVCTVWMPVYYLQVSVKVVCAVASVATVVVMLRSRGEIAAFVLNQTRAQQDSTNG